MEVVIACFKVVTLHLLDNTKKSQPPRHKLKLGLTESQE